MHLSRGLKQGQGTAGAGRCLGGDGEPDKSRGHRPCQPPPMHVHSSPKDTDHQVPQNNRSIFIPTRASVGNRKKGEKKRS